MKIHLIQKIDHFKGDWWLWSCEKEDELGHLVEGSVQADGNGEMIAEETFEQED